MQKLISIFYRHNLWANLLLCEACLALSEEELEYADKGAFGSIRMTLAHLARAEERYLYHISRWEPSITPNPDTPPEIAQLKERLQETGPLLLNLALTIEPEQIAKVGEGDEAELIPARAILLQAIHHANEHRTQICSIMGQLGLEPPSLSGWDYYDQVMAQN